MTRLTRTAITPGGETAVLIDLTTMHAERQLARLRPEQAALARAWFTPRQIIRLVDLWFEYRDWTPPAANPVRHLRAVDDAS